MTAQDLYDIVFNSIWDNMKGCKGEIYDCIEIPESNGTTTTIEVSGKYESYGYCEDDYFNGTGAWVTTYANVTIDSIEVNAHDENDYEVETDITRLASQIDLDSLEKDLKAELKAA